MENLKNFIFNVSGEGEAVLLIHGWDGSIDSLAELQAELSRKYKVYNLEYPYHGSLKNINLVLNLEVFADYVKSFIDEQELKSLIIVGHSFGGKIAIKLLSKYPAIAKKLVLINASGLRPKNSIKKLFWGAISTVSRPVTSLGLFNIPKKLVYKFIIREGDYLNTTKEKRETFVKVINEHIDNVVGRIKLPTLILWGKNDTYTPLWMGEKFNKLIKNSKLVVLDASHSLPIKFPKEVAEEITQWIE